MLSLSSQKKLHTKKTRRGLPAKNKKASAK
jgi:hypothetical protein